MEITYKTIPGYMGYKFGDDGSVWTCIKRGKKPEPTNNWRKLGILISGGYETVRLSIAGTNQGTFLVHSLILMAFVGPRPEGNQCCHGDNNKLNNSLKNLRWDTPENNAKDKIIHGTNNHGEKHGLSKLVETQVIEIREKIKNGAKTKDLAEEYRVSASNISAIKVGKSWRYLIV